MRLSSRKVPQQPCRPHLPPTLYALAAILLGETMAQKFLPFDARGWAPALGYGIVALIVLTIGVLVVLVRRKLRCPKTVIALVLASVVAGAFAEGASIVHGEASMRALSDASVSSWQLSVLTDATKTRYGWRCRGRLRAKDVASCDVWVYLCDPVDYGCVLVVSGTFKPISDDEWGRSCRMRGVWGTVNVRRVLSQKRVGGIAGLAVYVRDSLLESLKADSSDSRALIAGCVCGWRRAMDERGLDSLFSTCGVVHLIAVSGSHIAIVAALITQVVERLRSRLFLRVAATLGLTGLFVLSCGAPLSAIRAWAMAAVGTTAKLVGRREHALSSVCLVATVMALTDPTVIGQLGFTLSVSSVVGLCIFAPFASYALEVLVSDPRLPLSLPLLFRSRLTSVVRGTRRGFATTLVAQLVTFPLIVGISCQLSCVAPLTNALLSLPFTWLVSLGAIGALFTFVPFVQDFALIPCDFVAKLVLGILRVLQQLPLASIPVDLNSSICGVLTLFALIAVLIWWPRVSRRAIVALVSVCCMFLITLLCCWRFFSPARVVVLDVGQGDAILIQDGSQAVLVDTGPKGELNLAVARQHVFHLDAIILTHMHDDHTGGLSDLVGTVACDRVLVAEGVVQNLPEDVAQATLELTGTGASEIAYGDVVTVGGFELRMVWPKQQVKGDSNADSIELALSYEEDSRGLLGFLSGKGTKESLSGLLTGDAERDQTAHVIDSGDVKDVDFLKVGHHGSAVSIWPCDAKALDAEVAVASAGEGNDYGHPNPECVSILTSAGSSFMCTIDYGDITLMPGKKGVRVICQR